MTKGGRSGFAFWRAVVRPARLKGFLLAGLVGVILWRGASALSWTFFTEQIRQVGARGGIFFNLIGTLILIGTAMVICAPVIAQKAAAMPRAEVELQGFTDKIGSKNYNLALSRRRADGVARYLARQNVPLRGIHVIGLGEENPPASLEAVDPNTSRQEARRLARRVYIRVYAPATAIVRIL